MVTRITGTTSGPATGPVVIKLGGRALEGPGRLADFAADLVAHDRPFVLVHGGGAEVTDWCRKLNIPSQFHEGLRVTDEASLEVATAVLTGIVSSRLVAGLVAGGVPAVGLSGVDGGLLEAEPHPDADRLGRVGRVASVDTAWLGEILAAGRVPVLAPVAADAAGILYNINADDAAAAVAQALGASLLVFLSDVPSVVVDGRTVGTIGVAEATDILDHKDVTGGMRPKLSAALNALGNGVGTAVIGAWSARGDLESLLATPAAGSAVNPTSPVEADLFAGVYPFPRLELVHGRGCHVTARDGRDYLDFVSGIAVNALGHADPGLRNAVSRQMAQLVHVSNLYGNGPAAALAARLVNLTGYDKVFLCNSGAEGNEAALKFARLHAGAKGHQDGIIVAFDGAFHGRTAFALSATATPAYREPFGRLVPGIRFAPFNDAAAFDALVAEEAAAGRPLQAVLIEPVQGEAGARTADPAFLAHLRAATRSANALLLFDEVQCGVGRSGSFLAAQELGIDADITILAKGLGGGIPIGAVLIRNDLAGLLSAGQHGTTFGGNPVAAAASGHVLDVITGPGFLTAVNERAVQLGAGLERLVAAHTSLKRVNGLGLLRAIELKEDAPFDPAALVLAARNAGLLLCKGGSRSVRVLPPLVVAAADIDLALERLDAALTHLESEHLSNPTLALAGKGERS
ncbi:MAG TPA: acetylglutamate kinase [Candidatus Eisenbacteria bacterium]